MEEMVAMLAEEETRRIDRVAVRSMKELPEFAVLALFEDVVEFSPIERTQNAVR